MAEETEHTSGGSKEEVALTLWRILRSKGSDADAQLDFYVKCLKATKGIKSENH